MSRYEFKNLVKVWKNKMEDYESQGNLAQAQEALDNMTLYESLQVLQCDIIIYVIVGSQDYLEFFLRLRHEKRCQMVLNGNGCNGYPYWYPFDSLKYFSKVLMLLLMPKVWLIELESL
jgi:hypothetical protein